MYSSVLALVCDDSVWIKIRRLLSLNYPYHFPSTSLDKTGKCSFYFILMYLLAEQSSLVCKCELSDRCDKKFN